MIVRALFESRVMCIEHIAALFFNGSKEAATKRVHRLKAARLISERPRRSFEPAILQLARGGLKLLEERGILREYPLLALPALDRRAQVSALTIAHELEVMDVNVAFARAIESRPAYSIAEFSTWPLLHTFTVFPHGAHRGEFIVRPDGFIRVHERGGGDMYEHNFYLELDRSTEVLDTIVSRAVCYLAYYRSGGFAEKCGGLRHEFQNYPFRLLIVCKTAERRNNIAERLLQENPPILSHAWLSTIDEATSNPFGPVWMCPADYRAAVAGTAFEDDIRRPKPMYVRRAAREHVVETRVRKRSLLDEHGSPDKKGRLGAAQTAIPQRPLSA